MSQVLPLHLPTCPRGVILLDPNGNEVGTVTNPIFTEPSGTGIQPVEIVGEIGYASFDTNQVSIGATATQIVPANAVRGAVLITNPSSSVTVFIGGAGVTTANGQELLPGNSLTLPTTATVFGIVAASTQTISFVEVQ